MRGTTVPLGTPCLTPRNGELPMHRLEVPLPTAMPFTIDTFDAMGPMARAPYPHRHTFYEIVYVTSGTGAHVVDLARWPLRPPHLCVIVPGQVHYWDDVHDLDGFIILFTDDFLLDYPGDREILRRLSEGPWLTPDESQTNRLIAELHEEHLNGADGVESVVRALLHVLVVRAARLVPEACAESPVRASAVAEQFATLLGDPERSLWSVRAYADRIGVTPGYLTEVVRSATGRTASQLIREARVRESKRLLAGTGMTVRQIADRVGFADPPYFCRFFRRETGISPGDYRRYGDALEIHHDRRDQSIVSAEPAS